MEEVKKCYGCGAIIQSHNEKHIGWVCKKLFAPDFKRF